jgi:hypothetical protein
MFKTPVKLVRLPRHGASSDFSSNLSEKRCFHYLGMAYGSVLFKLSRAEHCRAGCGAVAAQQLCDPLDGWHSAIVKHPVAMCTLWVDSAVSCTPCHNVCRSPKPSPTTTSADV